MSSSPPEAPPTHIPPGDDPEFRVPPEPPTFALPEEPTWMQRGVRKLIRLVFRRS